MLGIIVFILFSAAILIPALILYFTKFRKQEKFRKVPYRGPKYQPNYNSPEYTRQELSEMAMMAYYANNPSRYDSGMHYYYSPQSPMYPFYDAQNQIQGPLTNIQPYYRLY